MRNRPNRYTVRRLFDAIHALPREERTYTWVLAMASYAGVSKEHAWRYAKGIGAPPRRGQIRFAKLTAAQVEEAEKRNRQGEVPISALAAEFNCSQDSLYARVALLRAEMEHIEVRQEAARSAGPRLYSSEFIRPVTPEMLVGQRARTRATLAESPVPDPQGP